MEFKKAKNIFLSFIIAAASICTPNIQPDATTTPKPAPARIAKAPSEVMARNAVIDEMMKNCDREQTQFFNLPSRQRITPSRGEQPVVVKPVEHDPFERHLRDPNQHVTQEAIDALKSFEGCRLKAYANCGDPWTIGYGHTAGVYPGMTISQEEAERLLLQDVQKFEAFLKGTYKCKDGEKYVLEKPTSDYEISSLVLFAFNMGEDRFLESGARRALNQGNYDAVPGLIENWGSRQHKSFPGLKVRRIFESELFARKPAPAPVAPTATIQSPATPIQTSQPYAMPPSQRFG
ncbi:MAG: lysozyme [Alphaproteobacteria bacterium]|nr:lysozyme [Alphaproteobacteria bacterium]